MIYIISIYVKIRYDYFSLFRISLQNETSSVREGYGSSTDDYYKFATYIKSNGVSTSEARITHHPNVSQENIQHSNLPDYIQPHLPIIKKGVVKPSVNFTIKFKTMINDDT